MRNLLTNTEGQGLGEYALILGLVALVVISAIGLLGGSVLSLFNKVLDGWPN